MTELGEGRGVAPGTGADVDDLAGCHGKEMQDVAMDIGKADVLVLPCALGGSLAVAFGAAGSFVTAYAAER